MYLGFIFMKFLLCNKNKIKQGTAFCFIQRSHARGVGNRRVHQWESNPRHFSFGSRTAPIVPSSPSRRGIAFVTYKNRHILITWTLIIYRIRVTLNQKWSRCSCTSHRLNQFWLSIIRTRWIWNNHSVSNVQVVKRAVTDLDHQETDALHSLIISIKIHRESARFANWTVL